VSWRIAVVLAFALGARPERVEARFVSAPTGPQSVAPAPAVDIAPRGPVSPPAELGKPKQGWDW